ATRGRGRGRDVAAERPLACSAPFEQAADRHGAPIHGSSPPTRATRTDVAIPVTNAVTSIAAIALAASPHRAATRRGRAIHASAPTRTASIAAHASPNPRSAG